MEKSPLKELFFLKRVKQKDAAAAVGLTKGMATHYCRQGLGIKLDALLNFASAIGATDEEVFEAIKACRK